MDNPNLIAAKRLADLGIAVFPCNQSKRPQPGVRWKDEASTDHRRIESWWRRWPSSLPAFELGRHKLVAIDCDRHGKDDGVDALETLARDNGDDPRDWPTVETPSTGRHIFFHQDGALINARGSLPAGIDVRGSGGYVIAEGTELPDGRSYHPLGDGLVTALQADAIPDLPQWLATTLASRAADDARSADRTATSRAAPALPPSRTDIGTRERAAFEAALADEVHKVAQAGEGQRNHTLNIAAFSLAQMVASGWGGQSEVDTALTEAAFACGLRQPEIRKTIASCFASGSKKPRGALDDRAGYGDAGPEIEIKLTKVNGVTIVAETGEVIGEELAPRDDYAADLMRWGGLVPEIARHIVANSRRPQPTFAAMAALSVISVAASRQMIAPLGSNLNLFAVLITRSANGKEAPIKLAPAILCEAGLGVMVAPTGGFASDIGLYGWMHKHPVTMWPANEFGDKLAELTAKGNSPNLKKIIGALRELYDGGHIDSSEAALRNSVTLLNPCLSVLAASTPEQFFDVIGSKLIKDGTLNRFMAVYAPKRVRKQDPIETELPSSIKDALIAIANRPGSLSSGRFYLGCCDQDPGKPYRIPWASDDAKSRWDAYEDEIIDRSENDKMVDDLAGRCAQKALRVASLLAVSDDWRNPRVSLRHVEMGIRIADQSLADTMAGMRDYVPEGPGAALQDKIRQKIAAKGIITHRDLLRSMQKAVKNSKELADLLILMQEGGDIVKDTATPEGGGPPTVFYQIRKDAA